MPAPVKGENLVSGSGVKDLQVGGLMDILLWRNTFCLAKISHFLKIFNFFSIARLRLVAMRYNRCVVLAFIPLALDRSSLPAGHQAAYSSLGGGLKATLTCKSCESVHELLYNAHISLSLFLFLSLSLSPPPLAKAFKSARAHLLIKP